MIFSSQNIDWHADSGVAMAMFWEYADFQKRAIKLWEEFARRYKDNTWVAGVRLLARPSHPSNADPLTLFSFSTTF